MVLRDWQCSFLPASSTYTYSKAPQRRTGCLRIPKWRDVTIKLIAYRAESSLVQIARQSTQRLDDTRSLIRQVFGTEVDLIPDRPKQIPHGPPASIFGEGQSAHRLSLPQNSDRDFGICAYFHRSQETLLR